MSRRSRVLASTVLLIATAAAAPTALAQDGWFPSPFASEPDGSGASCMMMCAQDYAPCDPYYFKQADGRCQVNHRGGRHH